MRCSLSLLALAVALVALPVSAADTHGEAAHPEHAGHDHGEHAGHGGHHVPQFSDINWFYGIFGESEGVEPNLLTRPKGMPAPFGIWIFDALVLYGFLFRVAKKPLRNALKNRKTTILRGMEEAARMKRDAEARLADYEEKLAQIDQAVERLRSEMRAAAEAERAQILEEARARQKRMEADAHALVAQELAAARDSVRSEMVLAAMSSAAATVKQSVRADDQQRFADEFLAGLGSAGTALRGRA